MILLERFMLNFMSLQQCLVLLTILTCNMYVFGT